MEIFQSITYKKDLDKCRTNSRTYPFLWLILYILDVIKSTTPDIWQQYSIQGRVVDLLAQSKRKGTSYEESTI